MRPVEIRGIAYHETGHAVMAWRRCTIGKRVTVTYKVLFCNF